MAYKGFTINELDLLNCIKLNSVCWRTWYTHNCKTASGQRFDDISS